ncbi:MAG: RnfABCDGE type electron transport complex subunit G [Lachnospiraceae bacterium]|nr:RnfABCDGE type electron transport complex subunit G [Lachnospiraceae bacterium]
MKKSIIAVITLTLITVIAGLGLGYVYELTKEPIAQKNLEAKMNAYKAVFPSAADFKEDGAVSTDAATEVLAGEGLNDETIDECLLAVDGSGNPLGHVMTVTTARGYGGDITISMGISNDGTLNGVEILEIGETAGLGMKADTPEFKGRFKDKKVSRFNYTKTGASAEYEIDALSGATITTNAMVSAVNAGLAYAESLGGN